MDIKIEIRNAIISYYNKNNISYTLKEYGDLHLLLTDYLEILRKKIPARKRKVFISRELKAKILNREFKEWVSRFTELKKGFENGEDMTPFLSKRYKDSNFRDRLLTCWKIHHIHFFPEKKSGDMLLFAVISDDAVYMIDVLPHKKQYVFSTYDLLNIVYNNWRFLYEPYRIKEATGVTEKITNDKDIQALRKEGICTAIEIQSTVYCLDMMATSGHSSMDVLSANNVFNTIRLNYENGFFCEYKPERVFLTGYHRPCVIVNCKNKNGDVYPLIL